MVKNSGWIGVDLDGVLAEYHGWISMNHIGSPIPKMVARVHDWVKNYNSGKGPAVKIFTARVAGADRAHAARVIEDWCMEHLGYILPITNLKDFGMIELWDDRAITVELNTGEIIQHPHAQRITP